MALTPVQTIPGYEIRRFNVGVGPSDPMTIADANPNRVALVVAKDQTSEPAIISTVDTQSASVGIVLGQGHAPLILRFRDIGALVTRAWRADSLTVGVNVTGWDILWYPERVGVET